MADPQPVEEPARRRFSIFGLEVTGCGCLLLTSPIWILVLIWLITTLFANQQLPEP